MTQPFLSIVIPAYNEENRLPGTLEKVCSFLEQQTYASEVLVVENGSQDGTFEVAQRFASQKTGRRWVVRALQEEERGKGGAVRRGMLAARGEYRFMCDADLSMPVDEIYRFLPPALSDYDIAIGSREAPGAIRYDEPHYRHLGGRAVNTMIRWLALPGLQDTQCGFKCFHAPAAEELFRLQTLTGWSFDIELLFIARRRGYRIVEVPIPWYFRAESKLNVVHDAVKMGMDILSIHWKYFKGVYDAKV